MIFTVEQLIHKLRQYPGSWPVQITDNEFDQTGISEVFLSPDDKVLLQVNTFFVRENTDDSTVEFDLPIIQTAITTQQTT